MDLDEKPEKSSKQTTMKEYLQPRETHHPSPKNGNIKGEIQEYNGMKVETAEVEVLQELERAFGQKIPQIQEGEPQRTFGIRIEGTHVVELHLSRVSLGGLFKVTQLPEAIGNLRKLRTLDWQFTDIKMLPTSIGNLQELEELNLRTNQLQELPDTIGQLTQLKQLDLSHNQLTGLPPQIGQLTLVENVKMVRNQLRQLPETIGNWTNVKELDLSRNQLETVPEAIGGLQNLRILDLSENKLTQMPPTWGKCANLEVVDFRNNRLTCDSCTMETFPPLLRSVYLGQNLMDPTDHNTIQTKIQRTAKNCWVFWTDPKIIPGSKVMRYCPKHETLLHPKKVQINKIKGWWEFTLVCPVEGCKHIEPLPPPKGDEHQSHCKETGLKASMKGRGVEELPGCPPHDLVTINLGDRVMDRCIKCHKFREEIEREGE